MHYYDLPTKRKQWFQLVGSIAIYGLVFLAIDTMFPEIDPDIKKKMSQGGLLLTFVAAALAGLGFSLQGKARHNLAISSMEISLLKAQIEVLKQQQKNLNIDLSSSFASKEEDLEEAEWQRHSAEGFPALLDHFGEVSLFLLAAGTLLCIIGEG